MPNELNPKKRALLASCRNKKLIVQSCFKFGDYTGMIAKPSLRGLCRRTTSPQLKNSFHAQIGGFEDLFWDDGDRWGVGYETVTFIWIH